MNIISSNGSGKVSKTKVGTIIIGLAALLGTIGAYLTNAIDLATAIKQLIIEIGAVIAALGLRDLPILNQV